ncbi:hypothetical protein [Acinetobacter venetianus]|uniref:hypothetical protein n=1 Tax=Acinetobacter venetianus TaxID=52133 RepID=UPI003F8F8EE7
MHLPLEILIIIGLYGFYLYDSARLYFFNEFNMTKGIRSSFKFQHVPKSFSFLSKYLFIPNMFFTHQLIFKCAWKIKQSIPSDQSADVDSILLISKTLKPLQWINMLLWLLMFVLLPVLLLIKLSYLPLAITIITIYILNISSLLFVILKRKSLQLSWAKIFQFSLDVMLCPPFALNLLRKISLNYHVQMEGIALAEKLLNSSDYQVLLEQIILDINHLKTSTNDKNLTHLLSKEALLRSSLNANKE